jgi:hypothetical protein
MFTRGIGYFARIVEPFGQLIYSSSKSYLFANRSASVLYSAPNGSIIY